MPIVDGHLDLAENVTLFGRDLTLTAARLRALERRTSRQSTVTLPELERGGIAVACATVTAGFLAADVVGAEDFVPTAAIYRTPEEAEAQALSQIALYQAWQREGRVRLLGSVRDLDDHLRLRHDDRTPGLVPLMEGADPIVRVGDLPKWWRLGLRMIGVTFGDTLHGRGVAGGSETFMPGGLTAEGLALLDAMAEQEFIWDVSHLTEDGVWQGLARVCASHANARALVPTDRHLSDAVSGPSASAVASSGSCSTTGSSSRAGVATDPSRSRCESTRGGTRSTSPGSRAGSTSASGRTSTAGWGWRRAPPRSTRWPPCTVWGTSCRARLARRS